MKTPIIEQLGGEKVIRQLVENFYDLMETHPAGKDILEMHLNGHGLSHVREEQFNFLCGFLGGRNYYQEKHGHMNVKKMHARVLIREEDALNWLKCMDMAIEQTSLDGPAVDRIRYTFKRVAHSLISHPEG